MSVFGFTSLLSFGILGYKKRWVKFNQKAHPKLREVRNKIAPIIVSNHVNIVDVFVHNTLKSGTFIGKAIAKKYPFLGKMA